MPFNRTYVCSKCGKLRRYPAHYAALDRTPPICCEAEAVLLSHEQAVAATRLKQEKRLAWMAAGGNIAKAAGSRGWRAV